MSVDRFNNFVVKVDSTIDNFQFWIDRVMKEAKEKNCNSILVQLHGSGAGLVQNFDKNFFSVRGWIEQESGSNYLELHCPLLIDNIPPYKTSRIGVLLILVDSIDAGNVLVVKERFGPPLFKFVTGAVSCGEIPLQAAVRELKEELGIIAEPKDFLLKALHQERCAQFGVDDYCFIYTCCIGTNPVVNIQESEIIDCKIVAKSCASDDVTLTVYTKTLIATILQNAPEPQPLMRGKKELVSHKFQ